MSVRNMGVNMADILPKPKGAKSRWADDEDDEEEAPKTQAPQKKRPPPQGKRQGWMPRSVEDFGDGGAFPEIHAAQYPLDMGRKGGKSEKTIGLQMDSEGNIKYDALLHQGRDSKAIVHVQSTARDLVAKKVHEMDVDKPDEEEVQNKTLETQMALEKIINGKLSAAKVARPEMNQKKDAEYIRYIPSKTGQTNSGAGERIIKMHEAPVDPLELPKFKHKKAPRGPPSPPVPVMHSPPRKVSQKDMADWKIPPCVSNWKNAKGYTIPLDKRLAADGRGHSQVVINDKFAQFSESLLIAQEVAREGISARIKERERQQRLEKEKKDEELRQLARDARMMRTGTAVPASLSASGGGGGRAEGGGGGRGGDSDSGSDSGDSPVRAREPVAAENFEKETREEREKRRERDEIRDDRRREREREKRLEELERKGVKRSKLTRDRDRDVSEKIALGLAQPSGQEMQFDQRLFNQSSGMDSGFGAEDGYNLYDGRLFEGSSANKVYRPKSNAQDLAGDEDITESTLKQARFKVDNEFSGASGSEAHGRSGPVEFDKQEKADVFGLDEFMSAAKKSRTN